MEAWFRSLLGLFVMLGLAWLCCPRAVRPQINWRPVIWGVALQFLLAWPILNWAAFRRLFQLADTVAVSILAHGQAGGRMVFGVLCDQPTLEAALGAGQGSIFAVQALIPVIIFLASLMAVLYHLRIMQPLVAAIARVMVRTMGTSGAETLSAVSNIFLGMTEAPLTVRPYLERMTRSELLTMMIGGMCTVAGTVLAIYVSMLRDVFPAVAGHLLTASVLSAPAGIAIAKLMLPETEEPETKGTVAIRDERPYTNTMEAITGGATEGLRLAANVIAMLIAMVALVAMVNSIVGFPARQHNQNLLDQAARQAGYSATTLPADWPEAADAAAVRQVAGSAWEPLTFERAAGWVFTPLAWCLGVPTDEVTTVARLLGVKTILNEFVAYLEFATMLRTEGDAFSERGRVITSYALCGFANLGSVAILIGGIGGLAPNRRRDLAELGLLSLIGGTLAACQTACVVGLVSGVW